jgi:hypothetical protein
LSNQFDKGQYDTEPERQGRVCQTSRSKRWRLRRPVFPAENSQAVATSHLVFAIRALIDVFSLRIRLASSFTGPLPTSPPCPMKQMPWSPLTTLSTYVLDVQILQSMSKRGTEQPANLIPELCRSFYNLGWVTGTGGGISIRVGLVLNTPYPKGDALTIVQG